MLALQADIGTKTLVGWTATHKYTAWGFTMFLFFSTTGVG